MAQPGVNRGELRTLVQGAFSAAKIVELGTAWGLEPAPEWGRSATEAAHGLVRDGEKKLGIQECIRRLRVAEPLIEWPDVDEAALSEWGPPSARAADPETSVVANHLALSSNVVSAEASPGDQPAATPADAPESRAAPPSRAPHAAAPFPGTEPPEPRRNGIEPKFVVAIGGIVLAIAIVAFAAGLLWSRGSSASSDTSRTGATASGSPPFPSRAGEAPAQAGSARLGPAMLAAGILEAHVLDVASRCSVPSNAGSSREVLELAMVLCDRKAPALDEEALDTFRPRSPTDPTDPDVPDPDDEEPRTSRPKPAPFSRSAPGATPTPRPPGPSGGGCIAKCKTYRSSCLSQCGPEPNDASKYDLYAGCTSKCVSAESRCRLACN